MPSSHSYPGVNLFWHFFLFILHLTARENTLSHSYHGMSFSKLSLAFMIHRITYDSKHYFLLQSSFSIHDYFGLKCKCLSFKAWGLFWKSQKYPQKENWLMHMPNRTLNTHSIPLVNIYVTFGLKSSNLNMPLSVLMLLIKLYI